MKRVFVLFKRVFFFLLFFVCKSFYLRILGSGKKEGKKGKRKEGRGKKKFKNVRV